MTWQPIDSAPRDGTRIIGWFKDRAIVVFWRSGPNYDRSIPHKVVSYWSDGYSRYPDPDCWKPEPDPPAGAVAAPPWKPAPPKPDKRVVRSPAARRRLVEQKPSPPPVVERINRLASNLIWCDQCQQRVSAQKARDCSSPFCKAKAQAA